VEEDEEMMKRIAGALCTVPWNNLRSPSSADEGEEKIKMIERKMKDDER